MAELDKLEHPKPLREFIYGLFNAYAAEHPWVVDHTIRPKSVARDLYERAMTFSDYIAYYGLERSEGVVLRYLTDAYKGLVQNVPEDAKTDDLLDLTEWLGELVRQVDSSLLDEWEALRHPDVDDEVDGADPAAAGRRGCGAAAASRPTTGRSGSWCATSCSAGSSCWPGGRTPTWPSGCRARPGRPSTLAAAMDSLLGTARGGRHRARRRAAPTCSRWSRRRTSGPCARRSTIRTANGTGRSRRGWTSRPPTRKGGRWSCWTASPAG